MKEKLNAPMISSEYGTLFDIVGWLLAIGGVWLVCGKCSPR